MKIINEINLQDFEFWGYAKATAKRIDEELGASGWDLLDAILTDAYPEGIDETELNDILAFEYNDVFEWLGIDNGGND